MLTGKLKRLLAAGLGALSLAVASAASAQPVELKIGYNNHPIQEASIAMMEKWAKANNVNLVKIPMSYAVFMEKVTTSLTSRGDGFDIIWHNDDWGQLWKNYLEPTDDVPGMDTADKSPLTPFLNDQKKVTAVPMVHTLNSLFYRKDLIAENEVPKTWQDLVTISQRLQKEGKVKWGFVGGMAMNFTWHSLWWTMWGNQCDVFLPIYERDNKVLADNRWTPALDQPCTLEYMNFWWDALNDNKISPKAMTSYTRDDAQAIFMAGDAAFTVNDTNLYGLFNDPNRSRIVGKIGIAAMPYGPRRTSPITHNEIWGWAIPIGVPDKRKAAAKAMLGAMMQDVEGQIKMWNDTGGPPGNIKVWKMLEEKDPLFAQLKKSIFDNVGPHHAAYYMPQWPAVHKAYSDVAIRALTGPRDAIPGVLKEGMETVRKAATD
jgi:multiple sugar transport system substrate-binding protein